RVLHARDATGREISRALWRQIQRCANLRVIEHARVVDLVAHDGRCVAAQFLDADRQLSLAFARATLLATGGAGRVYRETTNPPVATGDGVAMAYRAGARVVDLEFVQFHPTALSLA
ncbi:MAG: FAD-binding protein, partial [Gammaproteobacteria bacterium]|nr:FAD-binding protein [Gammaproteobacteria bacterium]NIT68554.1 FAD-binding protein [Gemmatimonadota bacterium]NIV53375.1 FAD-binding protein [Gammaproteobacteria bacterium]NIY37131.1 FAD-binding protein [Gemmatimonadota bacterium]